MADPFGLRLEITSHLAPHVTPLPVLDLKRNIFEHIYSPSYKFYCHNFNILRILQRVAISFKFELFEVLIAKNATINR